MEYLAGLATGIVLFLCFFAGYRMGRKQTSASHDVAQFDIPEEEKIRQEQKRRELEEIFSYNLDKAIRGGGKR